MFKFTNPFKKKQEVPMPNSLDAAKPRVKAPARKKNQGRPADALKVLAEYRIEHVGQHSQEPEREVRRIVGSMIIYRTATTPEGSKEGEGIPTPVEFLIMDDEQKHVLHETADTWGLAEAFVHDWCAGRGFQLVHSRFPFRADSSL